MRKTFFVNQMWSNFGNSETAFNEQELATQGGKPPFCIYFVVLATYEVLYLGWRKRIFPAVLKTLQLALRLVKI